MKFHKERAFQKFINPHYLFYNTNLKSFLSQNLSAPQYLYLSSELHVILLFPKALLFPLETNRNGYNSIVQTPSWSDLLHIVPSTTLFWICMQETKVRKIHIHQSYSWYHYEVYFKDMEYLEIGLHVKVFILTNP